MDLALSNKSKMFLCLGCIAAYAVVYAKFIKQPLLVLIKDLPQDLHTFIVIMVVSPVWIIGAFAVDYYLKCKKESPGEKLRNRTGSGL